MQAALFKRNAVLIEPNPVQHRLYEDILNANGFEVHLSQSAVDGFTKIKNNNYDIAVINTEVADESLLERLIDKIQCEDSAKFMPIIGLSTYNDENKKKVTKKLDAFLTKPISIDRFIQCISKCIEIKSNGCKNSIDQ